MSKVNGSFQVGGLPEVVQHGHSGITVPIRRPDLLAESILDVLNHQLLTHY